jgi:hypothetical protein
MMLHATGSLMLKSPTLALQEQEGKLLADRLCDLADYYKIDLSGERTGPWMVWIGFAGAMTTVYAPRIAVAAQMKRARQNPAAQPATGHSAAMVFNNKIDLSGDGIH